MSTQFVVEDRVIGSDTQANEDQPRKRKAERELAEDMGRRG
jgi:hypothetical protein